jgi:hypothetical protein
MALLRCALLPGYQHQHAQHTEAASGNTACALRCIHPRESGMSYPLQPSAGVIKLMLGESIFVHAIHPFWYSRKVTFLTSRPCVWVPREASDRNKSINAWKWVNYCSWCPLTLV